MRCLIARALVVRPRLLLLDEPTAGLDLLAREQVLATIQTLMQPGGAPPVAPSALQPAGQIITAQGMQPFVIPRALETSEIAGVVEDFRRGAANARTADPITPPIAAAAPSATAGGCRRSRARKRATGS